MLTVIEKPQQVPSTITEKLFFQVFLEFRKPDGSVSLFYGDGESGCGVYAALAEIFQRPPREIYQTMCDLAFGEGTGFMQEYLSLDDASGAVVRQYYLQTQQAAYASSSRKLASISRKRRSELVPPKATARRWFSFYIPTIFSYFLQSKVLT